MKITKEQLRHIIREELGKPSITEAKKLKLIVTNATTGQISDVAAFNSQGDLAIALTALQKAAPTNMKYSIQK